MIAILITSAAIAFLTLMVLCGRGSDFQLSLIATAPISYLCLSLILGWRILSLPVDRRPDPDDIALALVLFGMVGLIAGVVLKIFARRNLYR